MTTLANIRAKVRLVTARPSASQLSDDQIDTYINTFYQYDLPETMRLLNLKDHYSFTTNPNIDQYQFDRNNFLSVSQPAYCSGYQMLFSEDFDQFFSVWPKITTKVLVATGDGGAGPYSFNVTPAPFLRSSTTAINEKASNINLLISANITDNEATTVYDDGLGGFVGTDGTIDYVNGSVTNLTFPAPVPEGTEIYAQVTPYSSSRPISILFSQDKFIVRPVPDGAYIIQLDAYRTPTSLLNANDNPELLEWWQLLAYGAALKIFTDYGDFDQLQSYRGVYEEQLLHVQRRTLNQFSSQRTSTIYCAPAKFSHVVWPFY